LASPSFVAAAAPFAAAPFTSFFAAPFFPPAAGELVAPA